MKPVTRQKIVDYLYKWDSSLKRKEATTLYNEIISWLMHYFRVFIGEEDIRGSPVAIFDDVANYKSLKKWFCKRYATKGCKKLKKQRKSSYKFFTLVEPAEEWAESHYTGVRLYNNKIVFFDPACGVNEKNVIWDWKARFYAKKLAKDFNLKYEQFVPTNKCQINTNDIFCQTWSLMWEKKVHDGVTPDEASFIFHGSHNKVKKCHEDKELYKFIREIVKKKRKTFDKFVMGEIKDDPEKGEEFWMRLFKIRSPSHIVLDLNNDEATKDKISGEEKRIVGNLYMNLKKKERKKKKKVSTKKKKAPKKRRKKCPNGTRRNKKSSKPK